MIHLLQLLLKLVASIEEGREDTRIAESLLIVGIWFVLAATLFAEKLGEWRERLLWTGSVAVGVGAFLLIRRKARKWLPGTGRPRQRIIDKRYF